MVRLPESLGLPWVKQQLVDALPDIDDGIRKELGRDVLIARGPRLASVIRSERSAATQPDVHAIVVVRVQLNRVTKQSAASRNPGRACLVLKNAEVRFPRLGPVVGTEENSRVRSERG